MLKKLFAKSDYTSIQHSMLILGLIDLGGALYGAHRYGYSSTSFALLRCTHLTIEGFLFFGCWFLLRRRSKYASWLLLLIAVVTIAYLVYEPKVTQSGYLQLAIAVAFFGG